MIKFIDFLFWHYYCYFERHKKTFKGDNYWLAILMIVFTVFFTIGVTLGGINTFIYGLDIPKFGTKDSKILELTLGIPCLLYLCYRYYKKSLSSEVRIEYSENAGEIRNT